MSKVIGLDLVILAILETIHLSHVSLIVLFRTDAEVLINEVWVFSASRIITVFRMYWETLNSKLQMPITRTKSTIVVVGGGAAGTAGEPPPIISINIYLAIYKPNCY